MTARAYLLATNRRAIRHSDSGNSRAPGTGPNGGRSRIAMAVDLPLRTAAIAGGSVDPIVSPHNGAALFSASPYPVAPAQLSVKTALADGLCNRVLPEDGRVLRRGAATP